MLEEKVATLAAVSSSTLGECSAQLSEVAAPLRHVLGKDHDG